MKSKLVTRAGYEALRGDYEGVVAPAEAELKGTMVFLVAKVSKPILPSYL